MSFQISSNSILDRNAGDEDDGSCSSHSDSSFDSKDDQDWGDWTEEKDDQGNDQSGLETHSLFALSGGKGEAGEGPLFQTFPNPILALEDAKQKGCDLVRIVKELELDTLQVIRLVNHIRRRGLTPDQVNSLKGVEPFLNDDTELVPVQGFEMDGLLQLDFDELEGQSVTAGTSKSSTNSRIAELEAELMATRMAFDDLRKKIISDLGLESIPASIPSSADTKGKSPESRTPSAGPIAGAKPTSAPKSSKPGRDDDTHYFDSYASNDIHQTMISDSVRTLSYAKFILSPANAHLIRGKTVMDVGCGSGILSLFCARAGAKQVIAIDASDVADRARQNVEENGFGGVVRVVKGKVEELDAELEGYKGKVDLLVSEWMGYFLLYECMLPSVLYARDRYLNPETGILAPSHCRMTLAAISDKELLHERLNFWNNVHGFKMTCMTKGLTEEAYTESLKAESIVSTVEDIYDLPLQVLSYRQPTFVSPFSLTCEKTTEIHGFASWFDTWFTPDSRPWPKSFEEGKGEVEVKRDLKGGEKLEGLPPCTVKPIVEADVPGIELARNQVVEERRGEDAATDGVKGETVSFTTGPFGLETHWKQAVFLLKEPIEAEKGSKICGEIHVNQSQTNSRELDVEIHYSLRSPGQGEERKKGEKVGARMVQLFKVR